MKKGFTLIELLVVVLIIGILAAVALPQYQKAVIKSRYVGLKIMTESLAHAEELYKLANGTYTRDLGDLDIQIPVTNIYSGGVPRYEWKDGICWAGTMHGVSIYCVSPFGSHMGHMIDIFDYRGTKRVRRFCCVTREGFDLASTSIPDSFPTHLKVCRNETGNYGTSFSMGGSSNEPTMGWYCIPYVE